MSDYDKFDPDHYKDAGLEPFDVIDAWELDYYRGTAVKYIKRAGTKPGEQKSDDLRKAIVFLQRGLKVALEQERELLVAEQLARSGMTLEQFEGLRQRWKEGVTELDWELDGDGELREDESHA